MVILGCVGQAPETGYVNEQPNPTICWGPIQMGYQSASAITRFRYVMLSTEPVPTSPGLVLMYTAFKGLVKRMFSNVTLRMHGAVMLGPIEPIDIPTPYVTLQFRTRMLCEHGPQ